MANTYTLLEQITVGAAGASSVTFNSIPQTGYTDLVVKMSVRDNTGNIGNFLNISLNGSATSFTGRYLNGNGASASSGSGFPRLVIEYSGASSTANTFGNGEMYFPNYTSANFKSYSGDSVSENNATTAYADMSAGLWSSTAAITSITFTPNTGQLVQYSTFSLYGVSALGVTPTKAPKATGGSIIQTDGTYWYHAFLSSGTFTPATALSCDVLVVAGGGGGSSYRGGAGGAGGLLGFTSQSVSSAQTVTVGAGGAGGANSSAYATGLPGSVGSDSQFGSLTLVKGGGYGGYPLSENGATGGSGGGAAALAAGGATGGSATSGQGFAGGNSSYAANYYAAGGGGGAGAVGANAVGATGGGAGGAGSSAYSSWGSVTGTGQNVGGTYYYAGGGAGGEYTGVATTTAKAGGNGGGGSTTATTAGSFSTGGSGTANTGGGGAGGVGGDASSAHGAGGAGGSGIVIVRYLA
jgi:hypothetical protein